jgi:hypothetical protein
VCIFSISVSIIMTHDDTCSAGADEVLQGGEGAAVGDVGVGKRGHLYVCMCIEYIGVVCVYVV